jgi:serine/threonine protein kinase
MGEVYMARDTRLDRTVAVKILPASLAADPQFRERFDREAKALAALSHPHICPIHDIGSADGTDYLVMEFLEGQTLADRLAAGPLPLDQALTIATEIADALDKAHRAGIVHRDLKPGNIMLTRSSAKLLDFGLAKTGGPAAPATGLSMLPTTPANLTVQGTILGTFQYMAPEQLEGREADARTDLFAFGAVVYEMVTGRKAFEGPSQASLISSIMSKDPAPIASVQPLAPAGLDRLVRTCLAKDPEDRWQSARDLGRELERVAGREGAPVEGAARASRTRIAVAGTIGLLAGALAATLVWTARTSPAPPAAVRRTSVIVALDGMTGVQLTSGRPSLDHAGRVLVGSD